MPRNDATLGSITRAILTISCDLTLDRIITEQFRLNTYAERGEVIFSRGQMNRELTSDNGCYRGVETVEATFKTYSSRK